MNERILLVEDDETLRFTFARFLADEGYRVAEADGYREAMDLLAGTAYDLIVTDIVLEGKTGIDILREAKKLHPTAQVIVITGFPTVEVAAEAVRLGAYDFLLKPVEKDAFIHIVKGGIQYKRALDEKEEYHLNVEAVFGNVKDAIVSVDRNMTVRAVNKAAMALCGLTQESVGRDIALSAQGCRGKCAQLLRGVLATRQTMETQRTECRSPQRGTRILTITASPLFDSSSEFTGALMVVRDETRLAGPERGAAERTAFQGIIGKSEPMQRVFSLIGSVADAESTVLITGESGTGKELVAEAIHSLGGRSGKSLIKVNCAALPEQLLESELFGHVRGAFTGAVRDKTGRFQMAEGGTIFLDEIGDISPRMQLVLLRVLQHKEFERVGDARPVKVDVRIIAATNRDLRKKIRLGKFREDLLYRLRVVELHMPPLRERACDIPLLTDHFLEYFAGKTGKKIDGVTADVRTAFLDHPWPGNVRELEHTLEYAALVCRTPVITLEDLPAEFARGRAASAAPGREVGAGAEALRAALVKSGWNKAKAARLLGIDRATVYRKMAEYGIREGEE